MECEWRPAGLESIKIGDSSIHNPDHWFAFCTICQWHTDLYKTHADAKAKLVAHFAEHSAKRITRK
jgi:hypothetical protein